MNESKNFRLALLTAGANRWSEAITPLLLAQTDCLVVVDGVDELLSLPANETPEMIYLCHQPGVYDGITAAEQIRAIFAVTPLVFLSDGNSDIRDAALTVGALAVLEPTFTETAFAVAFNSCCRLAQALRWETLKQQQHKNRSDLLMRLPCCHLFIDNVDGVITFANSETAELLGVPVESAPVFSDVCKHFFAPHASTYPQELETAVHACVKWQGILSGKIAKGVQRIFSVICTPLIQADGTSGVLLTLHDITEEQSELAKLRTSLQAARDVLALADTTEAKAELQQLCSPNYSAPVSQETFSLQELLESVKSRSAIPAELIIPDYLPKHFRGDGKRLDFILHSLISGSAAFGEGTPRVLLSVKDRTPVKMTVQFTIHVDSCVATYDSYQGVADYLAVAGDILHAADGLGLAAVLVEQLRGTLLIRTERGLGRSVCCTMPLLLITDETTPVYSSLPDVKTGISLQLDEPPKTLSLLKILVAEDNLMEQATLKHLLEGVGCQAVVVGNGKEAVDEFETGEFDAVLMDILMPVMDGFEATKLIRERERIAGGRIPVIALTSYSLKAIQEKCISVGMNGYLAKPVAKKKLLEALQRLGMSQESSGQTAKLNSELDGLPVLDARTTLENIGYDVNLYRELIEMYLESYVEQPGELIKKLAENDLSDIRSCAHALKGMVANIGGQRLAKVAGLIQDLCNEGEKPDYSVWGAVVKEQSAAFKAAIENIDWNGLYLFVADK